MAVINNKIFTDIERGAGILEILLAMTIVAVAAPFVYSQIAKTNHMITDVRHARQIADMRDAVLNFVRMHGDTWPDTVQIRLSADELKSISDLPVAAFVDKYSVRGASVTDVYLGFDMGVDELRATQIASHIGNDAAVVGNDGVAYGASWAVTAPDFRPGYLVYKISRDFSGENTDRFLHRTGGDDELNMMQRDLNMGAFNVLDVGTVSAKSAKITDATAMFVNAGAASAKSVYFSNGATADGAALAIGDVRVTGDISGFRNISAGALNGNEYTTLGRIVTDRAVVKNSVNVSRDFVLRPDSIRTISGFAGISAHNVATPFLSADSMMFYDNFGLTISGELLVSANAPLKVGSWTFPSSTPPRFSDFSLSRAQTPAMPARGEFNIITNAGWHGAQPKQ